MSREKPIPKDHFRPETRDWFEQVCSEYILESHHIKLLQAACEAWDMAASAREAVQEDGPIILDRFGQKKPHPGAVIARRNRDSFRMIVRELGLDVAPPNESRPPAPGANAHLRVS